MPGAYIQAQKVDASGTSGGISITLTAGSNVQVFVRAGGTVTPAVTDGLGNTYAPVARDGSNNWPLAPDVDADTVGVYEAFNVSGGATTITVNTGSSVTQRHIAVEFSGTPTTSAVDKAAFTDSQATTTPTSGTTASRTQADEILMGCISSSGTSPGFTAGAGFTKAGAETTKSAVQYQIVSVTGTDAAPWTMGVADTGGAGNCTIATITTLKAAASSSPPPSRARTIKTDRAMIIEGGRQRNFSPRRAMSGTRRQEGFSAATVANSTLSAAGDSTATFVGAAQDNSVLAAAGDATATFTGASKAAAVLSAAADATATFTGASKAASVLSAAGDSSATFTGAAQAKSTLSAPGDATASFTGAALDRGVLNAPGDSSLSFVGRADAAAVWNAAGDASAAWIGSTGGNVLSADGDSSAIFVGAELAAAVLAAAGDSSALWSGTFTLPGGDELGARAPVRGRAKARKPPKQRRPIYRHPEEVERERRMLDEYLESLETKARPASEEPVRPGESQDAPTRRAEPVAPRLSDVMARLASAQQLELIARAESAAKADKAKAKKEHQRRRVAAIAVLMMGH